MGRKKYFLTFHFFRVSQKYIPYIPPQKTGNRGNIGNMALNCVKTAVKFKVFIYYYLSYYLQSLKLSDR